MISALYRDYRDTHIFYSGEMIRGYSHYFIIGKGFKETEVDRLQTVEVQDGRLYQIAATYTRLA